MKTENSMTLRTELRKAMTSARNAEERQQALMLATEFVKFIQLIYTIPMVPRLMFYRMAFHIYNFLRLEKQLGRRVGEFSGNARYAIYKALDDLQR